MVIPAEKHGNAHTPLDAVPYGLGQSACSLGLYCKRPSDLRRYIPAMEIIGCPCMARRTHNTIVYNFCILE